MKRASLAVAILLGALPGAHAASAADSRLTDYVLDNGLRVILDPDHRVPKVALTLTYNVGSANESPGRSGFAHLFEHLMFSGTPAFPSLDATFGALGVDNNAFTQNDQTVFYDQGLASALPVLLSVEADRMANLGNSVDQRELDAQREVVLQEMAQNVLDSPGQAAGLSLSTGLYPPGHPYSHATIGSIPDVRAAGLADVKAFFSTYYVPNNAILTIVGDFAVDAVKADIAVTLGAVPRGADVTRPAPVPFDPLRPRVEAEDPVAAPVVVLSFNGPTVTSRDNGALAIASELLDNSEYGVLKAALVDKGLATFAYASWGSERLGGAFTIGAGAAPGVAAADLEAALKQILRDFIATPLEAADVNRARAKLLLDRRVRLESLSSRAFAIGLTASEIGDLTDVLGDDPDLVAATAADVASLAGRLLDPARAGMAVLRPGPRGAYPAVLANSTGTPVPLPAVTRPPVVIPKLAEGTPGTVHLPEPEIARLTNGIEIVHYQLPGVPMIYLAASASGGTLNDPAGKEGLIGLAARMSWQGAGGRDFATFAKAAKDLGANLQDVPGGVRTAVLLDVPPEHFAEGVALLADAVQRPRFDRPAWDILKRQALQGLEQARFDPAGIGWRALNRQLFHSGPGEPGLFPTTASLNAISLEDARAIYGQLFVPSTLTFYSVGALPLKAMLPALEKEFGGWTATGAGMPSRAQPQPSFPAARKVIVAPAPAGAQSVIYLARPAPGLTDPDQPAMNAVVRLLGGEFLSRLNTVLREQKGYSYGVDAGTWNTVRHDSGLYVDASVASAVTGPALAETFAGFAGLGTVPVTPDELRRGIAAYLSGLASQTETAESVISLLASLSGSGMTMDEFQSLAGKVTQLQLPEVQAAARQLASLDRAVVVIAGDPKAITSQLAAIGIREVEVLPAEQ